MEFIAYIKLNYMRTIAKRAGGAESFLCYLLSGKILIQDFIKLRTHTYIYSINTKMKYKAVLKSQQNI